MIRRIGATALAIVAAVGAAIALTPEPLRETAPISATAIALDSRDPSRTRVGALTYAGGLSLQSTRTARFGGVSGLLVDVGLDGRSRAAAVTDSGDFLAFDLDLDADGRLVGVGELRYTMLRDEAGRPLPNKEMGDAEDLARLPDGSYAVAFEQQHRIVSVGRPLEQVQGARRLNMPAGANRLPLNSGFEGLAVVGDALVAGAEDGRIWRCPIETGACALLHGRGGPSPGYLLTGLDALPGSDTELIAVYRSVNVLSRSFRAIIAQVSIAGDKATVTPLARLAAPLNVHNMEGIAAAPRPGGVRLYLISDNGFGKTPTLLLAFDWLRD